MRMQKQMRIVDLAKLGGKEVLEILSKNQAILVDVDVENLIVTAMWNLPDRVFFYQNNFLVRIVPWEEIFSS